MKKVKKMKTQKNPVRIILIIAAFIVAGVCFNTVFGQKDTTDSSDREIPLCESVIDINITKDLENESVVVVLNGELLALSTPNQTYSINCIVISDGVVKKSNIAIKGNVQTEVDQDEEVKLEDWMFDVVDSVDVKENIEEEDEIVMEDWMMNLSSWKSD